MPTGGAAVNARDLLSRGVSPYTFQEELGGGRFLESVKCRAEDGAIVVVKIYVQPAQQRSISLKPFEEELRWIRAQCSPYSHPNLLPYQRFFYAPAPAASRSSSSALSNTAFLVRQYAANNVYDRLSTHPFLTQVEKLWISYQLLQALYQCHSMGICHGDVKAENVLVTSWDWVLLADFAPHKPTFLPSDEPAQYNYFFASSKRGSCCVAPERFCSMAQLRAKQTATLTKSTVHFLQGMMDTSNSSAAMEASLHTKPPAEQTVLQENVSGDVDADGDNDGDENVNPHHGPAKVRTRSYLPLLKASMDIFSAGCVIAELFADGAACFDLSELLRFARHGEKSPHLQRMLAALPNAALREMLESMLSVKPDERGSAEFYLKSNLFPDYLPFFFHFARDMLYKPSADERIWAICDNYASILRNVANGYTDPKGEHVFRQRYQAWRRNHPDGRPESGSFPSTEIPAEEEELETVGGREDVSAEALIEETADFLRSLEQLQGETHRPQTDMDLLIMDAKRMLERQTLNMAPAKEKRSTYGPTVGEEYEEEAEAAEQDVAVSEGMILPIALICATMRFVEYPSTKVTALRLLSRFSAHVDDSIRLQRIVPYVVMCLSDSCANVRCAGLRLLTSLLEHIDSFPPSDAKLFQEFLLPGLHRLLSNNCQQTKVAFFECMPRLAAAGRRFVEISTTMRMRSGENGEEKTKARESYDEQVGVLQKEFDKHMRRTIHESAAVKRSLLFDVDRLSLFFGHEDGSVRVLGTVITFLNEREDWQVLATLFDASIGLSALVGPVGLEKYLLPCIEQALYDREEMVVHKAVHCLKCIVLLGLVHEVKMVQIVGKTAPLLYHPGAWVRTEVLGLIAAILASPGLSAVDIQIRVLPFLKPFLKQIDAGSHLLLSDKANKKPQLLRLLQQLLRMPVPRDKFNQTLREMDLKRAGGQGGNQPAREMQLDMTLDLKLKAMGAYLAKVVNETKSTTRKRDRRQGSRRSSAALYYVLIPHQAYVPYFMAQHNTEITSISSHLNPYSRGINPNVGVLQAKYGIQLQLRARPNQAHPAHQLTTTGDGSEALTGGISRLQRRIRSLDLPPLPPDMGTLRRADGTSYSIRFTAGMYEGQAGGAFPEEAGITGAPGQRMGFGEAGGLGSTKVEWRPKGVLMATLHEHDQAVNKICVAQDQLFFATGSSDGTVRLWLTPGLERTTFPRSALTYASQGGAITDLCMIDNTHSIASASDRGTVHVFAVEHAYSACTPLLQNASTFLSDANVYAANPNGNSVVDSGEGPGVGRSIGSSIVLEVDSLKEGAVRVVQHFSTATQSLLVFATERCEYLRFNHLCAIAFVNNMSNSKTKSEPSCHIESIAALIKHVLL